MGEPLEASGLTQSQIAEVAKQIRRQLVAKFGFRDGEDVYQVVERLGGQIAYDDVVDDRTDHGSIEVRGVCDFTIYLPEQTPERRDRFTIAHELGHYFLHAKQGKVPGVAFRSLKYQRQEWEANWFAASLLMPAEEFMQAYERERDPSVLASAFGVSVAAARVRIEALNLGS